MDDRALQFFAGIVFVYMAWVFSAMIETIQEDRIIIFELVDRISALEEKTCETTR